MGTQILVAESYQRWIYWVSPKNHEVTANEMAEITSLLYDNKVVASKEFSLSSGTKLKIPQPALYLSYIVKAVKAANSTVLTKDDIIYCLNDAEKMRWGNDISGDFKNYYYSYVYKGVRCIDSFSGEGKEVDFLFINGIPTIKCDCGNPIENKNPPVITTTEKEVVESSPPPADILQTKPETKTEIKILYSASQFSYRPAQNQLATNLVKKNAWDRWLKPTLIIGGATVVFGGALYVICGVLSNKKDTPIIIPAGKPGGAPTGDGGSGGSPGGAPAGTGGGPGGSLL